MKICIGSYSLSKGNGVDVTVCDQALELSKKHDVTVVARVGDIESLPGVRIKFFGARLYKYIWDIKSFVKKEKFDVLSSHNSHLDVSFSGVKGSKHLLHDYGLPDYQICKDNGYTRYWAQVNLTRYYAVRKASMALPSSQYILRELINKTRFTPKSRIIHTGMHFPEITNVGNSVGIKNKYALYVGRHNKYKNIHTLIENFLKAKKALNSDIELVTIGNVDPGYQKTLEKYRGIDGVNILGYQDQDSLWRYYKNASAYVTCSLWEGEDRPVIEAQYFGVPAIAYNNCSHPEVISFGHCVDSDEEFVKMLVEYLGPEDKVSLEDKRRSHDYIKEEFSSATTAKRYNEIVECITSPTRAGSS